MHLFFTSQRSVKFNGKTVRLILDSGDQAEAFTVCINGNFKIIVIQSSGSVMVILDHTTDRNLYSQNFQDF